MCVQRIVRVTGICICIATVCAEPIWGQSEAGLTPQQNSAGGAAVWADEVKETSLAESSRLLAMQAMAEGRNEVPVVVASTHPSTNETGILIRNSGGKVLSAIPEIGYTHAVVPVSALQRIIQAQFVTDVAIAGTTMFSGDLHVVQAADVPDPDPTIQASVQEQEKALGSIWSHTPAYAAYSSDLPYLTGSILRRNPEMDPNSYMQVDRWREKHPAADGRGVTIAIFDGVGDLGHPALQWALNGSGQRIPKIAGILDAVDHVNVNPASYFDSVEADGEVEFSAPHASSCARPTSGDDEKVGIWTLHWYAEQKDLCVAWDDMRKALRLALPGETLTQSSRLMTEFNYKESYLHFPVKEIFPKDTSDREVTLFCIQDPKTKQVFIHLGQDAHSTMVATAAAGTSFMGTQFTGAAPGARILYIEPGEYRLSEMIEGIWKAASRKDVDLVSVTTGIDSYPNDPQPMIPLFLDRISVASSKPIFVAAGNEGNALEQDARGGKVIVTVGSYEPGKMMRIFGYDHAETSDHVAGYSASGPNADGSWSTTLVTPTWGIVGWECGDTRPHPASARVVGSLFRVPSCWATGGGTSVTTPRAAGAAALLLSAAKLRKMAVSPDQIRRALIVSAIPIPGTPTSLQGAGRIQIESSWAALQEGMARGPFVLRSVSSDVAPLYPQFWRGRLQGSAVYRTRHIHPGEQSTAELGIESNRRLDGCKAFIGQPDSGFTIPSAIFTNAGHSLHLRIETTPKRTGLLTTTVEIRCPGSRFPLDRIPVTLAVTPSPESLKSGSSLRLEMQPDSQQFALFELPADTQLTMLRTNISGDPDLLDISLGSSPLPSFSGTGFQSVSTTTTGDENATVLTDQPDLLAIRIENVAMAHAASAESSISLTVHALSSSDIRKESQTKSLIRSRLSEYVLRASPAQDLSTATFDLPSGLTDVSVVLNDTPCSEAYLFHVENGRGSIWNRLGCRGGTTSTTTVPHPLAGKWIVFSSSPIGTKGYINAYGHVPAYVNPAQANPNAFERLGHYCIGLACNRTWPLQNPTWRDIPLVIDGLR